MRKRMETYVKLLQRRIVVALSAEEAQKPFFVDSWVRKEGGEGISCVLQGGDTFDKAGVNISVVHGMLPPAAVREMSADHAGLAERTGYQLEGPDAEVKGLPFYAAGLSLVVHPRNPFAPTVHFNYRYFEITHPPTLADGSPNPRFSSSQEGSAAEPLAWWFGGGTDLTPSFLFEEDAKHFHATVKEAADKHDAAYYPAWKRWCDKYFWIPHRYEARGVGGIFFDDLSCLADSSAARISTAPARAAFIPLSDGTKAKPGATAAAPVLTSAQQHDRESLFATVRDLGDAFLPAYLPILQRRKNTPFDATHERWQALRRGRYVEFNLVYDRGTKFGLQTPGARIESILMSLPLKARFEYMEKYSGAGAGESDGDEEADGKEEKRIQQVLRNPRDWV